MMSSVTFLNLLKEEPTESSDTMDSTAHLPLHRPVASEPPPLTHVGPMQPPVIRPDMDGNFESMEPIPRGRANTWPLHPTYLEEDLSSVDADAASSAESHVPRLIENLSVGAPKKNTSRRNPWGNMSYADLIAQAIVSSPEGRATLSQVYDWMVQNVPYFKDKGDSNSSAGWKNSIRHNLSLHNRFMRMQNEGTGKSSWWVLNPDAKPGKSTRRRASTLEGGRTDRKRGRGVRKKGEAARNGLEPPASPSMAEPGPLDFFPASPSAAPMHHSSYQLSPQDFRQRASSNASSSGRHTPIPSIESDMHDSQVPPMSPGMASWGPDFWMSPPGSLPGGHPMSRHLTPHGLAYSDHLVESIEGSLKLDSQEPWGLHGPHMGPLGGPDCLKVSHGHHHINGFVPPHPPHFGSYEDFNYHSSAGGGGSLACFPHSSQAAAASSVKDKHAPSMRRLPNLAPYRIPPLQTIPSPSSQSVSPSAMADSSHFSPPSCDHDLRPPHTFPSPQPHAPTTGGLSPPLSSISLNTSSKDEGTSIRKSSAPPGRTESTAMLRVALSHREAFPVMNGVANFKPNSSPAMYDGQPYNSGGDFVDLDNIQGGGLECNVDEVIKHELQYGDQLNFDFPNGQSSSSSTSSYSSSSVASTSPFAHPFPPHHHHDPSAPQAVQMYSCPSGNQWVR